MTDRNKWTEQPDGTHSRWMSELHLIVDPYEAPEVDVQGGWYGSVVSYSPDGGMIIEHSVFHGACFESFDDAKAQTEKWAMGMLSA